MRIVLFALLIILASCIEKPERQNQPTTSEENHAKKATDSDLAARLYGMYHAEPSNQEELDQNDLLDYAVDHNLDVTRTNTGLFYIIHTEGVGPKMQRGQPCKAHYTGYFLDGKIFDSSHKRGVPIAFNLGQMMPAWNEALLLMNPGTKAQLLIPSRLGYGPAGFPGYVPPNTPMIFDIEVLPAN